MDATAETEKQFISVERVQQYLDHVPQEVSTQQLEQPLDNWPAHSGIRFHDVRLRYRPALPLALDHVTFQVNAGEKVGVVGRTGSGKTSLFSLLFRLVEPESGHIEIGDVNIAELPLELLRF